MSRYVPLRFNDVEQAALERIFAASEDAALGTHIKRVYFDASQPNTNALQGMRRELETIREITARLQAGAPNGPDPDLLLSLVCGIYLMVRQSVGAGVRAQADQFIDASALEGYLGRR